jgi:hypothetical protein
MVADIILNKYVALDKNPDSEDCGQKGSQSPEKIGPEVLKRLHYLNHTPLRTL